MRKIRKNVFETNSSSTHSIHINTTGELTLDLPAFLGVDSWEQDKILVEFGEFGWEEREYNDAYTKLQYALTYVVETEARDCESVNDFYKLEGFKTINDCVKEYMGKGLKMIRTDIHREEFKDSIGDKHWYCSHNGYIDHQSVDGDINLLLEYYGITIAQFIFSPDVVLITDNDNH